MMALNKIYTEQELKSMNKDSVIKILLQQQSIHEQLRVLTDKMDSFEAKLNESQAVALVAQNVSGLLQEKVKSLEIALLKSEQYSRRECLDINGMDNQIADEDLEGKVCELLQGINITVNAETDIQACHRYGKKKDVIVKFSNRKMVSKILAEKRNLPENVYINESLCPRNKALRGRCSMLKRDGHIANVVTKNGMVRIKKLNSNVYTNIFHEEDLKSAFPNYDFPY